MLQRHGKSPKLEVLLFERVDLPSERPDFCPQEQGFQKRVAYRRRLRVRLRLRRLRLLGARIRRLAADELAERDAVPADGAVREWP